MPSTPEPRPEPLDLYIQTVRAIELQASSTRELTAAVERGFTGLQEDHRCILQQSAALTAAVERQAIAMEARTELWQKLSEGVVNWLKTRWGSILLGLAVGLGLAGARELLSALMSSLLGSPP